jgi:3-oxoacyl-[acyl-carrier protein] reductase
MMMERDSTLIRIAVVTGTSRHKGIGAATCMALASKGIDIFFTFWTKYDKEMPWGIHNNEPELLQEKIMQFGVRCEKLEVDNSDISAPGLLLDSVEIKLGKPSILINNATYSVDVGYDTLTAEVLDKHYQVNIRGTMLLSSAFAIRFNDLRGGKNH